MTQPDVVDRPSTILIANDHEWTARSIESVLGPTGATVVRAFTGQQALDRAAATRPDLIILDSQLPDLPGAEVCRRLRADERFGHATPIIITTAGPSGRVQRLAAYDAGAWEFYGQPLDGEALLLRLKTFLQAKRAADAIRREHLLDEQSGLYSLRGLSWRAREIGAVAVRHHQPLACLAFLAEVDDDELSEAEVAKIDGILAELVGRVAQRELRASDAMARTGIREFAVIAPSTDVAGARSFFTRLGEAVESRPLRVGERELSVRLRGGLYAVPNFAQCRVEPMEMLTRAAAALEELRRTQAGERMRAYTPSPVGAGD
ncbi:MAG: response regulator [Gemmatimonadota bacterium]